jgi:hypothetical protein
MRVNISIALAVMRMTQHRLGVPSVRSVIIELYGPGIERRVDKHCARGFYLPSAVSIYRSEFFDCATNAVGHNRP